MIHEFTWYFENEFRSGVMRKIVDLPGFIPVGCLLNIGGNWGRQYRVESITYDISRNIVQASIAVHDSCHHESELVRFVRTLIRDDGFEIWDDSPNQGIASLSDIVARLPIEDSPHDDA